MSRKTVISLLIGFFVLTIIIVNVYNYSSLQKMRSSQNHRLIADMELLLEEVRDNINRNQVFNLQRVDQDASFYDPVSLQNISVFDVLDNGLKLILRIPSDGCEECTDKLMIQLKEIGELIGQESIAIFTDFTYPRQIGVFAREHNIDFRVYSIPKFNMGKELDKYAPYFFILDKELLMKNLFFPFHTHESLNRDYLISVAKVCFKGE